MINNDINMQIQAKLDTIYNILNDEGSKELLAKKDDSVLYRLREEKEALAKLYNQKAKDGQLQPNDKTNILYMQIKEYDFYKKSNIRIDDIGKLFCDYINSEILIDDDYLILDILNISDEIFDRYEVTISNRKLLELAVKKFPENKNFKTILEHLTSSENA